MLVFDDDDIERCYPKASRRQIRQVNGRRVKMRQEGLHQLLAGVGDEPMLLSV